MQITRVLVCAFAALLACGGVIGGSPHDTSDASTFDGSGPSKDASSGLDGNTGDAEAVDGSCAPSPPPPCDAGGPPVCDGCTTPVVVAACQTNPSALATDGTNVYWRDLGVGQGGGMNNVIAYPDGTLMESHKLGFPVELGDHLAYYSNLPNALLSLDAEVYVSTFNVNDAGAAAVLGFDANSCASVPIMTISGYGGDAFAATATRVFWTASNVWSCSLNGCTNPEAVWVAPGTNRAEGVATDGIDLFWSTFGGDILSCPVTGCVGPPTVVLSTKAVFSTYLVLDASNVYASSNQGIVQCAKSGCALPTMVGSGSGPIATDGSAVYWTNGDVFACAVGGCASATKVAASGAAAGVAVDSENVYWADMKLGMVLRVPK